MNDQATDDADGTLHRVPAALDARYTITGRLGHGGKATVYEADDRLLSRRVAIKVFRALAETPEALREQETEARVIAGLNHYALTTLLDAGVDASDADHPQIYLVMELVRGTDLKRRLQQGPLEWLQVVFLGHDLSEGLHYLHEAGFLHRDIKPANVLLADRDAGKRLRGKLADFGIASLLGGPQHEEFVTGTAAYLSPEVVEDRDAGPASDVYSLGLVLLEALTGRVAFPGGIEESAFARLDRDPEIPMGEYPDGLRTLLRAMTARDPAGRPTPEDVAARFQDLLVDEIVRQRGPQERTATMDEGARIAALRRYNVLDTPPEEAFDKITRLASKLLGAPIALISIIDSDRVWLKSRQGYEAEAVDRNVSFCAVTNPGTGPWMIPDATVDPRTANNPVVVGAPNVRSYAAAPLTTSDGHHMGSLCVYDLEPREFDESALETLSDLAGIVMDELELRIASRRAIFER